MVDTTETLAVRPAAPAAYNSDFAFGSAGYAWFVVGALSITNVVSFLERQIVTLMFGPIKRDFGVSDFEVALLTGFAFSIFAVLFGLLFGRLADRKSRKMIIMVGVVAWSCATVTCGLARNFIQLLFARIAVGVGEATLNSSALSMISDYFPRHRLTRAVGLYTASVAIGSGLAYIIGGGIIYLVGQMGPLVVPVIGAVTDWQATFIVVGVVGALVLVPLAFIKEPPRRGLMNTSAEVQKKGAPFKDVKAFAKRHFRFYFCHIGAFAVASIVAMGAMAWTPEYFIRVHGWSPVKIGFWYGSVLIFVSTAGVLTGGFISEWMDRLGYKDANMRLALIALLVAAIPGFAAYLMPNGYYSIACIIASSLIGGFATAPLMAALQLVTPNEMRGQVMAVFALVAGLIGPAFGPLVIAFFTDFVFTDEAMIGWSIVSTMVIVKPIFLILLYLSLRPYREGLAEAQTRANNVVERAPMTHH